VCDLALFTWQGQMKVSFFRMTLCVKRYIKRVQCPQPGWSHCAHLVITRDKKFFNSLGWIWWQTQHLSSSDISSEESESERMQISTGSGTVSHCTRWLDCLAVFGAFVDFVRWLDSADSLKLGWDWAISWTIVLMNSWRML